MARVINFSDINTEKTSGIENWLAYLLGSVEQKCRRVGLKAEKQVAHTLADSLPDSYVLINNFALQYNGHFVDIDHIVIGESGVFCVETKAWTGIVRKKGSDYISIKPDGRTEVRHNPERQVSKATMLLKDILVSNGLKAWITNVVCFPNAKLQGVRGEKAEVCDHKTLVRAVLGNPKKKGLEVDKYESFFLKAFETQGRTV